MHGVPHLSFFEFKAVGQHDASPVFLASGRVSDGLYIGLGDTLYPDCRTPLLTRYLCTASLRIATTK